MSLPARTRSVIHDFAAEDRRHLIMHTRATQTLEEAMREADEEARAGVQMLGRVLIVAVTVLFFLFLFALPYLVAWVLGLVVTV
jgi:hypothetical protein